MIMSTSAISARSFYDIISEGAYFYRPLGIGDPNFARCTLLIDKAALEKKNRLIINGEVNIGLDEMVSVVVRGKGAMIFYGSEYSRKQFSLSYCKCKKDRIVSRDTEQYLTNAIFRYISYCVESDRHDDDIMNNYVREIIRRAAIKFRCIQYAEPMWASESKATISLNVDVKTLVETGSFDHAIFVVDKELNNHHIYMPCSEAIYYIADKLKGFPETAIMNTNILMANCFYRDDLLADASVDKAKPQEPMPLELAKVFETTAAMMNMLPNKPYTGKYF